MNNQTEAKHICSHRHSFSLDNVFRKLLQSPAKIVGPYINRGDTVMDIGCGPGFFTLSMAELVGPSGSIIAIDLQQEMLKKIEKKIKLSPTRNTIMLHQCKANGLGLSPEVQADFILAYYMVHETSDQFSFFTEIRTHLKHEGRCLVVEPPFHVGKKAFQTSVSTAEKAGLHVREKPKKKGGMSVLLTKEL